MTFFPQHFLGLMGMPRRYVQYPDLYLFWNKVSRLGRVISLVGLVVFTFIIIEAFITKRTTRELLSPALNLWYREAPIPFHTHKDTLILRV